MVWRNVNKRRQPAGVAERASGAGRAPPAPDFAAFLTRHISDTVKSWDAKDMSRQIELNIGKDLQFIRVNGTLVGGTIGLILFYSRNSPSY
jgi:uncharacterized membrane-anchored protein YjiN (DUF445 family)